ncbi:hypothetical protein OSTOST_07592 [Ostertagia ostertagi]
MTRRILTKEDPCGHGTKLIIYLEQQGVPAAKSIVHHIEDSVRMSPYLSFPDIASGGGRQLSGDGRQAGMLENIEKEHRISQNVLQVPGALFTLGGNGMPETPPPMDGVGSKEERGPDRVHEEILQAMTAFFLIRRIEDDWGDPKIPENITEITQEHFMVNDSIFTVKTFAEHHKDREKIEIPAHDKDIDGDVFPSKRRASGDG